MQNHYYGFKIRFWNNSIHSFKQNKFINKQADFGVLLQGMLITIISAVYHFVYFENKHLATMFLFFLKKIHKLQSSY